MATNRIYIVAIIAAVILAGGIGWSVGTKSTPNSVQEKPITTASLSAGSSDGLFSEEKPKDIITLKRAVNPTAFHLGAWVFADKYGFYKEEGIKIENVLLPPGAGPALAALQKGEIDLYSPGGHPDGFINAFKGGVKVTAVVASSRGLPDYPHDTAWVLKDSPIKEPKDVIGKKVGGLTTAGWDQGCMAFFWNQYFKKYGIDRNQVINAVVPGQQMQQAIQQGLIDIMTVHPPLTGVVERSGKYRRLWSSWDVVPGDVVDKQDAEIAVVGFSQEFIKKNPDVVRRYVRATIKAQAFDIDNHELFSDWIQGLQGWEPKVREGGDHHNFATGLIKESAVQKWIDWYVDMGLLKPGEIKPSDLYTNEFNPYNKYKVNDPVKDPTYWDTLPKEYLYIPVKNATSK